MAIRSRMMPEEPTDKRGASSFEVWKLFRHAGEAFGHDHADHDPVMCAAVLWVESGWTSAGARA
ncbi:MAG: hypothetical protein OXH76_23280 [Boseongicola sp.]|nr:hypothetical protein [Boseongicola sp.]